MATGFRSAVFLDRDGVINELAPDRSSGSPESPLVSSDVRLLPRAAVAVRRLREAGLFLVGVSNQPASAKGSAPLEDLLSVQARVVSLLADAGATLDDWRLCMHHPHGVVPELTKTCTCRKPAPGLLLKAASEFNLDLGSSWMVGDTDADIGAGAAAGCRTVLLEQPLSAHKRNGTSSPDWRVTDLESAADLIVGVLQQGGSRATAPKPS